MKFLVKFKVEGLAITQGQSVKHTREDLIWVWVSTKSRPFHRQNEITNKCVGHLRSMVDRLTYDIPGIEIEVEDYKYIETI